jgi:N,N'-diacetyllegionaminate synthase
MADVVEIAGRQVGVGLPPLVIAEAGVNHGGQVEQAHRLIEAAAATGADAVKFQTFSADAVIGPDAEQAAYQRERAPAGSQLEMARRLELPPESWTALRDAALERGLIFLSTPFDTGSIRLLASLDVPALKISSGDLTNLVLLRAAAATRLPLLLSTGMATVAEIDATLADLHAHGDPPIILLHCTSAYPAATEDANLMAMQTLRARFRAPVGYSDHTLGIGVSVAAAALGAAVIEKHLTLDRDLPGPDHHASLEADEFAAMVSAIREAFDARGSEAKAPVAAEGETRRVARRSLVAARRISAGEALAEADLDARRPEGGISPQRLDDVLGRRATRDIPAGGVLSPGDVDPALDG